MVDALSKRNLAVQEIQLQSVGINALKDMYKDDNKFKYIYCKENCNKEYNHFHIIYNRFEMNMQLKFTCKIIDDIPTKI